ncbi:MAG: hypothetical protein O9353_02525, partial [Bacteroidia bacterium]|nr:hypothetical protein [Bacteroidia bacterium]
TETALLKASYILYKNKAYAEALPLYQQLSEMAETPANKLSGKIGAMRSAFILKNYETALEYAVKVLATDKISPQQINEAKYDKAKSLYELNRLDDAMSDFKAIAKTANNVTGAEAFYHVAKIQYTRQDYSALEKTITSLIAYDYSNDDWNSKGLLLLSDAYIAKGEYSDAELMLQTVIDGKAKAEYIDEATKKLAQVKALKGQGSSNTNPGNSMNVEFKSPQSSDKDLFDQLYDAKQDSLKQAPKKP